MAFSANAYADTLGFSPPSASLTVPAGETRETGIEVSFYDDWGNAYYEPEFCFVRFANTVYGDIPPSWIAVSPSTSWYVPASATLQVSVPEDAAPGEYSGRIVGYGRGWAHDYYYPELYVSVYVPSLCSGAPVLEVYGFGPEVIWPPDKSMEELTVSGRVLLPEGCEIYTFGYGVHDEYDVYTGMGEIELSASGEFTAVISVEASREGKDRDGRHYGVTVFAMDEEGNIAVSEEFEAVVPHDMRAK